MPGIPTADPGSMELYEQVLAELQLQRPEVTSKKMWGVPSMAIEGKPFACLFGEDMVFKLGAGTDTHAQAMALAGTKPFDPMGGRPMKAWVQVPPEHAEQWTALAEEALHNHLTSS